MMTEEDTFNRLKKWTWEDTRDALIDSPGDSSLNFSVCARAGWVTEDWLKESFRRNKERIIVGNLKTEDSYVRYWINRWKY